MEERDFVFKIPMVYHKKHHCQSFDKILGWSSLREPAFSPQRSALLMITLGAEKLPLPPPPFFFLPSCFEWPTWKTNTTCKKRAQEGHNQHINLWSALVFEPVILHALWNGISYLMVIMHSLIFHMVKLAMPHWITMNFSRAYMLSMLLYGNPFSQHHQCLSEIW